jgi:ABC-type Fe3+-siderophore transport system permease subunit
MAQPVLDFSTEYQKKKAALAIFGILIMLGAAYLSAWGSAILIAPNMAIYCGLAAMMIVGGFLGFLVVLAEQTAQQIKIKIEQEPH